ncbi:hypothetical protein DFH06DRAFT_1233934 [Mycena polygramma]|nr:hypothetical protein DFH06DRAFT_1233934 [Mycena polygramma]
MGSYPPPEPKRVDAIRSYDRILQPYTFQTSPLEVYGVVSAAGPETRRCDPFLLPHFAAIHLPNIPPRGIWGRTRRRIRNASTRSVPMTAFCSHTPFKHPPSRYMESYPPPDSKRVDAIRHFVDAIRTHGGAQHSKGTLSVHLLLDVPVLPLPCFPFPKRKFGKFFDKCFVRYSPVENMKEICIAYVATRRIATCPTAQRSI